jgi:hypothetical protein
MSAVVNPELQAHEDARASCPEIADYKVVRCEWAAGVTRYAWCKEKCKLLGAAVCPRGRHEI